MEACHQQRTLSSRGSRAFSMLWPMRGPLLLARPVCRAGRHRDRSGRQQAPQVPSSPTQLPTQLLRSDYAEKQEKPEYVNLTVYSCRFSTGHGRGAALSNPTGSAVNVCLIGKDGRSVLRRISPVNDPLEAQHDVEMLCQIVDDGVGADCPTALKMNSQPSQQPSSSSNSSYTLPPKPPPAPRLRFQEGHVDEVVFLAPELGPLAAVLVGTENGTWVLDELQVASSRTHHIDRFVCRKLLGSQPCQGAAYLTPVPPGSVVYGTGDTQVLLSKDQAAALHSLNMEAYEGLKQRLLTTTFILTAGGTWVAGLAAGLDAAVPFALGGLAGITYQWLLQQGVDNIVASVSPVGKAPGGSEHPLSATATLDDPSVFIDFVEVDPDGQVVVQQRQARQAGVGGGAGLGGSHLFRKILASPAARIAFLGAATALTLSLIGTPPEGVSTMAIMPPREQLWQMIVALLGFMTYKVALVSVSLSTPPVPAVVKAGQKASSSSG